MANQSIDELNARRLELMRIGLWHKRNIEERRAKEAMTLEHLVKALEKPRGASKSHVAAFADFVRGIVRAELGGAS